MRALKPLHRESMMPLKENGCLGRAGRCYWNMSMDDILVGRGWAKSLDERFTAGLPVHEVVKKMTPAKFSYSCQCRMQPLRVFSLCVCVSLPDTSTGETSWK